MMLRDWAHAAFEASSRADLDGAVGVLHELTRQGQDVLEEAMRLWMDRTTIVMTVAGSPPNPGTGVALSLEMEADSTGELADVDKLAPAQVWSGRMFLAYAAGDDRTWDALMASVPPTTEALIDYTLALLRTLTTTADAYAEQCEKRTCCLAHAIDVETLTAQIAVSHLN